MPPTQTTPAKSNKTTLGGVLGALGVLLALLVPLFDGDPSTHADLAGLVQAIGALLAAFGVGFAGFAARDDDVTSEGRVAPKAGTASLLLLALLPLALLGCTPPTRDADAQAIVRLADRALATAQSDYEGGARFSAALLSPAERAKLGAEAEHEQERRDATLSSSRLRAVRAARGALAAYLGGAK